MSDTFEELAEIMINKRWADRWGDDLDAYDAAIADLALEIEGMYDDWARAYGAKHPAKVPA